MIEKRKTRPLCMGCGEPLGRLTLARLRPASTPATRPPSPRSPREERPS